MPRFRFLNGFLRRGLPCLLLVAAGAAPALAHDSDAAGDDVEFETKHVFGVTAGTDVGEAGDREIEFTTVDSIGKRGGGRYNGVTQEGVYEAAPSNRFGFEAGPLFVSQQIASVAGLNTLSQTNFSGLVAEPKYIFVKRGIDAPVGFALSLAPEWDSIDPVIGAHAKNFVLGAKAYFDAELIEKKLYGAINLIYSPEVDNETGYGVSQYALTGATGALTWRIAPRFAVGAEIEAYRACNSLGFANRIGSAAYAGPTLWAQLTPKAFISASWSSQFSAGLPGGPAALAAYNQSDFSRQRVHVVIGVAF